MASKRLLIQTMDSWRETLSHVKEQRAREDARRRKRQQKKNIKNLKNSPQND